MNGAATQDSRFPHFQSSVPDELKVGDIWVCCNSEKAPMVPLVRGWRAASSTNPETWRSYETALEAFETHRYSGIGRVFQEGAGEVGVDIDGCRDPQTGQITPWAWSILERLNSYSEVSPSKTGVKTWVRADLDVGKTQAGFEIYPKGRYFTVTGQFLPQFSTAVEERQEALEAIIAEEFPKVKKPKKVYDGPTGVSLDLDEILEVGRVEILAVAADTSARIKYRIVCPWANEHTGGDVSGTYAGQYEDGGLFFQCHHSHCRDSRKWDEFREKVCPRPRVHIGKGKPYAARKAVINLA